MLVRISILVALFASCSAASADTFAERGRVPALVQAEQWSEVERLLTGTLETNPYHGEDWYYLGLAHARRDDCEAAAPLFVRAIELGVNGTSAGMLRAHVEAAQCAVLLEDLDAAVRHLDTAQARYKFDPTRLGADPRYAALLRHPGYRRLVGRRDWSGVARVDGWSADLDYFTDLVERRHPDPFHGIDENAWRDAAAALRDAIPDLSDLEVVGGFMRLAGLIGDGHTSVYPPFEGPLEFHMTPIWPYAFGEDWRIVGAAPEHADLVGARIVAIEGVPIAEAARRIGEHLPADNTMTHRWTVNIALQFAELAQAAFAEGDACCMTLEIESESGQRRSVQLTGGEIDRNPMAAWAPAHWPTVGSGAPPLWLKNTQATFWHAELDELGLIYAQINQIRDGDAQSLKDFGRELVERLTERGFSHLVIDLRHNNGGNGYLNWPFVRELLRAEVLDEPGRLFVIVGRRTFSAAMLLSSMLEFHTNALFVGEPTGSRPQFYGEDTEFRLPYSGLMGSISSRWFQNRFIADDERPWIAPDIVAELTIDDLRQGRDPAMAAIVEYLESR